MPVDRNLGLEKFHNNLSTEDESEFLNNGVHWPLPCRVSQQSFIPRLKYFWKEPIDRMIDGNYDFLILRGTTLRIHCFDHSCIT